MFLKVSDLHEIWYDCYGSAEGEPVVYLHGGPGGTVSEWATQYFDPAKHRVVFFEQRGCGRSKPFADIRENTLDDLIEDMERLRQHLGLETWHLFGGSFGSTLALAYAIRYPERVRSMILRGIFLGRQEDIDWLYQDGASYYFPEAYARYSGYIPEAERGDLISAYARRLFADDPAICREAAGYWSHWEGSCICLYPLELADTVSDEDVALARLECHYFLNKLWWDDDNFILNHAERIAHIPTKIVHGRYDMDCRPVAAYQLAAKLQHCDLQFIDAAGHSSKEPGILKALTEAMQQIP